MRVLRGHGALSDSLTADPYPAPTAESGGGVAVLPGSGDLGDGCGDLLPTHVCWAHGDKAYGVPYVKVARHSCELRTCPRCAGPCGGSECAVSLPSHGGGVWAHREAFLARDRWEDFLEQHGLSRAPIRQVVVSLDRLPESTPHAVAIRRTRQAAERVVRRFAWRGRYFGSVVVHLWRGCDEEGYNTWGPHAHVLCLGIEVGKVAAYHRRSGTIVKQVNGSSGGWASYRGFSLLRHLVYELGHAAILPDAHALVWFGALKTWGQPKPRGDGEVPRPKCPWGHEMEDWSTGYHLVMTADWGWTVQHEGCQGRVVRQAIVFGVPDPPTLRHR